MNDNDNDDDDDDDNDEGLLSVGVSTFQQYPHNSRSIREKVMSCVDLFKVDPAAPVLGLML